jgi:hypothetical protein
MISYQLKVEGLDGLERAFRRAPDLTKSKVTTAMNQSLVRLQATAKSLAPVDTSRLRSSILIEPVVWSGSEARGQVGTNVEYAAHQEQGTGIYGPTGQPIRPRTKKVLAWKKGNTWHFAKEVKGVRPKWYMRGSIERNQSAINGYFATALDEVTQSFTGGSR